MRITYRLALAATAVIAGLTGGAEAQTLKVVPYADLRNIDPIWTTATVTNNHAYMIYDVLFALDEQLSELIVLENGDTRFVAIRGDDHFLVHGTLWRKVSASVRKPAHPHVEDQPEPG